MCRCILVLMCVCAMAGVASAAGHPAAVVYLPMDGNLNDASGNGHNATVDTAAWGTATYVSTPTTNGRVGQGMDLDVQYPDDLRNAEFLAGQRQGGGAYMALPYTMTPSGSLSLWYKTNDFLYNYQSIFDNSGTDYDRPEDNWEMWLDNGNNIGWRASKDSANGDNYNSDGAKILLNSGLGLSTWVHITATWQRLTTVADPRDVGTDWENSTYMKIKMYLNGTLVDQTPDLPATPTLDNRAHVWSYEAVPPADPTHNMTGPGTTVYFGGGCYNFTTARGNTPGIGSYDELGIWNVMLTDAEVMDVYLNGVGGTPPPPILGDANGDRVVNNADATILANNWHKASGAVWADGDFNGDFKVDDKDASILAAHWGNTGEGMAANVPEPSTLALLAGALVSLVWFRRKR